MIVANVGTPTAAFLNHRQLSLAPSRQSRVSASAAFTIPPVLLASDAAMEKIFAGSAMTYAQTLEKAKTGEMVSRDLGKTATLALRFKLEETTSNNVVAVLEGSDAKLKEEAVVYSAHYDAYGIDGGRIFPGAADNALGIGTITSLAEAFIKAFPEARPARAAQ